MFGFNSLSDFWFGSGRGAAGSALSNGSQYQYIGANPYNDQQNALISQLQQMANGQGPSLAVQQYKAANQDAMANQLAMSRGRGAGAARNASVQMGQLGAGLAGGSAMARTREQMGAMGQLQNSLTSAGQMDFQRAAANQQMYQNALAQMMQQGGIGQSLAGLAGQGLGAYAMLRGPNRGGGPARPGMDPYAQQAPVGTTNEMGTNGMNPGDLFGY
jgi:hypothetical protein